VHTSCDSRTAIVFVSEGSERVKTATLSFKLNQHPRRGAQHAELTELRVGIRTRSPPPPSRGVLCSCDEG
jgi:hypothetical protein